MNGVSLGGTTFQTGDAVIIGRSRGRVKGYALYIKEVDENERTIQIVQEIYNDDGNLIAVHQKYPEDTGHVVLEDSGE